MKRRKLQILAAVISLILVTLLLATACAKQGPAPATEPIKLGLIGDFTGPLTLPSSYIKDGAVLAVEQIGSVLGRPLQLIVEDDGSDPNQALDKTRKLWERDKVAAIIGPLNGGSAVAMLPYENTAGIPSLTPAPHSDQVATLSQWTFQPFGSLRQNTYAAGVDAAKNLGFKTAVTIGEDFTPGYEFIAGFKEGFEANGGKVIEQRWVELTATDFSPYILGLPKADCVAIWMVGSTTVPFYTQYAQLKSDTPLYDTWTELGFVENLDAVQNVLPKIRTDGLIAWFPDPNNAQAPKIMADYKQKYGKELSWPAAFGYTCVQIAVDAIKTAGSTTPSAIRDALYKMKLDTSYGTIQFNSDRMGEVHPSIIKVANVGGKYVLQFVRTYNLTGTLQEGKVIVNIVP